MVIFGKKDKNEKIFPNILITNYCNQKCSFCFANKLMSQGKEKEMTLEKYIKLLAYLERNGINKVFLMGGEPTIHSKFKEIIEVTLKKGFEIEIFTNANLPKEIEEYLIKNCKNISMFHINIGTPAYVRSEKYKDINNFIKNISKSSVVSLETTIGSLNRTLYLMMLDRAHEVLKLSFIRIGVDGAFILKNGFSLEKNLKIGKLVMNAIDILIKNGVKGIWLCEINACMFSKRQLDIINNNNKITLSGFGCLSKRGGVDIKTDLKVIRCFGQDCLKGYSILGNDSLEGIKNHLDKVMIRKSKASLPKECCSCKYYGYSKGDCPGPCLIGR